uniref:Chromo domain-containing protein n=2 Tax=Parascaris univalens TaxID=6257 RepID=A0A915A7K8_PARUN
MSDDNVEESLVEGNGDIEHPHISTKENDDIPSRENVLDVSKDTTTEEDADKKENKDEEDTRQGGDEEHEGDDTSDLEEGEFEVERILDVKLKGGIIKFEVRWKGYGSEEDSWEPEENLETARLLLDDYIARNKEKVEKIKRTLVEKKKKGKKSKNQRLSLASSKEKRKGDRKSSRRSVSTMVLTESEEDDEVKERKEETRRGTQRKKRCRDQNEEASSNITESSGNEDFIAITRSAKRTKKAGERTVNASATKGTRGREEPILKEPRPRNAKNSWLYDDADDGNSDDDSDHNGSPKKQKKEEGASEADSPNKVDKSGKRPCTIDEEIHALPKRSRKEALAQPSSKKDEGKGKYSDGKKRKREASPDEQEDGAVNTAEDGGAENNKSVDDNTANNESVEGATRGTEEVEVIGIVKMKDSGVQVMYRKKDGKTCLLTVEEAVALNAMALVEYLLARTVFTSGRGCWSKKERDRSQ